MSFPHWGDVPAWIGAISTAGAFATGGVLLRRESREGRRRDDERRQDEVERRQRQAGSVAAWPDRISSQSPRSVFSDTYRSIVRVFNASTLPVYDATLLFVAGTGSVLPRPIGVVSPGSEDLEVDEHLQDEHFPQHPGWLRLDSRTGPDGDRGSAGPDQDPYLFSVGISFRDAAGVWWTRRPDGVLVEGRNAVDPPTG